MAGVPLSFRKTRSNIKLKSGISAGGNMKNINVVGNYSEVGINPKDKIEQAEKMGAIVLGAYGNLYGYHRKSHRKSLDIGENEEVFKIHAYGKPFTGQYAKTLKKEEDGVFWQDGEKEIVGHVSETFSVNDDWDGIKAVAEACGYGHSDWDEEAEEDLKRFNDPDAIFLTFGLETWGYREVTGGVVDALKGTVHGEGDFDEWDVYKLEPGMDDGGIVVQSSSSGSMVEAQKKGDTWNITLTMPKFEDGSVYDTGIYANSFKNARSQYENTKTKK